MPWYSSLVFCGYSIAELSPLFIIFAKPSRSAGVKLSNLTKSNFSLIKSYKSSPHKEPATEPATAPTIAPIGPPRKKPALPPIQPAPIPATTAPVILSLSLFGFNLC